MTRSRMPSKMSLRTAGPSTLRMEIRSEYKVERELSGFCRRLLSRLAMEASSQFPPTGGRTEIDHGRELDRFESCAKGSCLT
jgi:hypothetical protein